MSKQNTKWSMVQQRQKYSKYQKPWALNEVIPTPKIVRSLSKQVDCSVFTKKTTNISILGQTCQNEEIVYEKELTQLRKRTTICSELTSHLTKCPEIWQNLLLWLIQTQMIQLHGPMHVFGKRISDWFIHSYGTYCQDEVEAKDLWE